MFKLGLFLSIFLFVFDASHPSAQTNSLLRVVDDSGTVVELPSRPLVLASFALFIDEILSALVEPSRLVSVSSFAVDPTVSNVSEWAGRVKLHGDLNVETILSLRPDLVLTADWSDASKIRQLRDAGLSVYVVKAPRNFADLDRVILLFGRLTGEKDKAASLQSRTDARLDDLRLRWPANGQRLTALDDNPWGAAFGSGSSWNAILEKAGVINLAQGLEGDAFGQVPLSKEVLVSLNPDLLFFSDWVYGDPRGAQRFFERVRDDPALKGLKALSKNRLYLVPERLKSTTSQFMVEAAEYVWAKAYSR